MNAFESLLISDKQKPPLKGEWSIPRGKPAIRTVFDHCLLRVYRRFDRKLIARCFLMMIYGVFFLVPHFASAATVTWTGAGADNNWSTSGNWTGGTGVPTSADAVVFSGDTATYPNADKDSTWDSSGPATVKSVDFQSGYAGNATISKSSVTVAGSYTWAGTGTFSAGTGTITFSANGTFTPGGATYNNITAKVNNNTITTSGTATIAGDVSITSVSGGLVLTSGTWNVSGNVSSVSGVNASTTVIAFVGTGNQSISNGTYPSITVNKSSGTLSLSGTISMSGVWTHTAGTVDAGTSTVSFKYSNGTFTPGTMSFYNLSMTSNNNTITLSGGDAQVSNNLTLSNLSGTLTLNGNNILVKGNITSSTAYAGTTVLKAVGTGSQTLSGSQAFRAITIDKPSGTLTLSGTIILAGNWTHTKGTVNPGSSTLSLTATSTFTAGSASYNNITIAGSSITLTVSGTATILGNLTISTAGGGLTLSTGTLNVFGDVSISGSQGMSTSSTATIQVGGGGAQTLSSSGGGPFDNVTINKTGGTLTLSGTIPVVGDWTHTTGNVNAGTSTLRIETASSTFTPGSIHYYNLTLNGTGSPTITVSGTATVTNTLDFSGSGTLTLNTGTISAKGNVTRSGNGGMAGTATIQIVGTSDQTLSSSGGGTFSGITVNKSSGVLSLSGTIPLNTNGWTYTAGIVSAGTSKLKFTAAATFTPGTPTYYDVECSGTAGNTVTLAGNLKLSNTLSLTDNNTFTTSGSNYSVTTGNLTLSAGTFTANASVIKVSGNISGTGTFTAGTSTVILNGTSQTISNTRTYYNLYKYVTSADTLTFTHTTTYTIASGGTARFIGSRGNLLSIQSSSAGTAFTLTKTGSIVAEYVSLKDCTVSTATSAVASTSVSGNTNWTFTKEFISTIRATGGDYTTLSGWESAIQSDLTAATTKVFSHSGITGTIADNSSVTGATSGATGTAVHTTSTQILIKSISGTFQSGEQIRVDVSNYVTSSDAGNGAIAVAECYNDWPNALNDSITLSGWTTDADNFILVIAPDGQSHDGKLKDTQSNYYRGFTLKPSSSTAIVYDNQQNYTRTIGLAIDGANATATNFRLNGTSPQGHKLLSANGVDGLSLSGGALVTNTLAYDGTGKCFEDTTSATTNYTVYNSTAQGCAYGFHGDNTTTAITIKNSLASGNITADFALTNTGSKTITYSASSDGTSDDFGTTTGDRASQTFTFKDSANKDFHLADNDAGAKNFGLDLVSDGTYPISDDIEYDSRPAINPADASEVSVDIGADEYEYDKTRLKDGIRLLDGVRVR